MLTDQPIKICVVGLWHQGTVAAACFAEMGYDVLAADPIEEVVRGLASGKAPLYEPGLDDLLQSGLAAGNLRFTTDVAAFVRGRRFVLVMLDTPVDENDETDLTPVFEVVRAFAPNLEPGSIVLVTAQVPVGTCDRLAETIRGVNPEAEFGIAYSPENLRLGQAIERFRHPALPVLGGDDEATLTAVEELLSPLKVSWERVSLRTAEMVKHGLNAFLATSISFGNELGNLCDDVGADGKRLGEVLRLESRIGSKAMILPGLGFSGGTIARDLQTLRRLGRDHGQPTAFLDGVWSANRYQLGVVLRKLKSAIGCLKGRRIAILGLTYKPDTSTLRRSASLEIIADLVAEGAVVTTHDPKADREELKQHTGFVFHEDVYDAIEGVEALVLITGWKEYVDLDFKRVKGLMTRPLVVDPNNMLDAARLAALGFTYRDVGRGREA